MDRYTGYWVLAGASQPRGTPKPTASWSSAGNWKTTGQSWSTCVRCRPSAYSRPLLSSR